MKSIVKFSLIALTVASLSGCGAALVGGGAVGGYEVAKNKGAVGRYADDSVITSKIKGKYVGDLALKSLNISVSTNHGVVSLVGAVPSKAVRDRAIIIAQDTKGVVAVNASNLTVNSGKKHATTHHKKAVTTKTTNSTTKTTAPSAAKK